MMCPAKIPQTMEVLNVRMIACIMLGRMKHEYEYMPGFTCIPSAGGGLEATFNGFRDPLSSDNEEIVPSYSTAKHH